MGNSAIIIRSTGPHQNNLSYDAEQVAARCVAELKSYGHHVLSASVETGGSSLVIVDAVQTFPVVDRSKVTDPEHPARCAYERYLHASGGKSLVSGVDLPGFDALSDAIKAAWMAAVDHTAPRLAR